MPVENETIRRLKESKHSGSISDHLLACALLGILENQKTHDFCVTKSIKNLFNKFSSIERRIERMEKKLGVDD